MTDAPLVPQEPCPECGGDGGFVDDDHGTLIFWGAPLICTACAGTGSIEEQSE